MKQRHTILWVALVLFFSWVFPLLLVAEEPAYGETTKQDRAAKYAARRNILIQMMPWEMRSDVNYFATLADSGLIHKMVVEGVDVIGAAFTSLTDEYLRVHQELTEAEKANTNQDELDRLTKEMMVAFDVRVQEVKGMLRLRRLSGIVPTSKRWGGTAREAVPNSKRWYAAMDELLEPRTFHNLMRLAPLADAGALPQDTIAQLDDDLKRLRELGVKYDDKGHPMLHGDRSRLAAYDELQLKLDEQIKWLYQNLPTSPRWKAWEKKAKENK